MKVTVEVSDKDLKEIMRFSGENRKGAAIRKLAMDALMLKKRREIAGKFLAGKWSVDLPPIEKLRKDRAVWKR
ncbi:MAG: hypothetical protein ACREP1_07175 [Rhodanobacteraceae bacterium]